MSQKSSADDLDIESQHESLLVNTSGAPRRRWKQVFLVLKTYFILISMRNNAAIEACAVDDHDVELQRPTHLNTGKTPSRRWHLVCLVVKALRVFASTANNTLTGTQLELINGKLHPEMSKRSSADDLDIDSLHESLLVNTGGAPRRRWKQVFLVLKTNFVLISMRNNAATKACAVDDHDVELQQPTHLNTGKTPSRRWHLVCLVVKALRVFVSTANNTLTGTQLESTGSADTAEPEPTRKLLNNSGDNIYNEGTDVVLQTENIARMVRKKDLNTLRDFGGVPGIAEALNSDMAKGIPGNEEDLNHRRTALLKPKLEAHNRNFIHYLRKSCNRSTIYLLLILAIVSFAVGITERGLRTGWDEGALTLGAVILIVIVHSIREFRNQSSRQLSRNHFWNSLGLKVHVLRGGCGQIICISNVLVGDVVLLEKGTEVPADGLLISTESLEVDDKADPIIGNLNPFLFYGSKVTDGTGKMLVTSVGAETKLGKMLSTAPPSKESQAEEQLNMLSTSVQKLGIVITIIIILVSVFQFIQKKEYDDWGLSDLSGKPLSLKELNEVIMRVVLRKKGMFNALTSLWSLLLVGVAEGLPLAIAIAMTCWNKRMLGYKTFAQEPSLTVSMATVTIICTDETGGLTLNPQEVERCWIGEEIIREDSNLSIHVEAFCNGIRFLSLLPENSQTTMDKSILSWAAERWKLNTEIWKQHHCILEFIQPTHNKNIVAALIGKDTGNGPRYWHCKGSAATILDMCSQFYDIEGKTRLMDRSKKKFFEGCIKQILSEGFESIAFACKQVDDSRFVERNLTLSGLLGLKKTVREGIEECREAGIRVLLASSEEVSMLQNIATAFGVIAPDSDEDSDKVIRGETFRSSSAEERIDMVARISVMGNTLPSDRLLLVNSLKGQGHRVAVVGNRTNDIPTLEAANVGLAFASSSTEIARKSSDIVIPQGNFTAILSIMKCGRCIYSSIRKYIQFQLTMTLAGFFIPLIMDASHGSSPITAIQLHWAISVLTLLGGLALLMEPPGEILIKKLTLERDGQLVTKAMWVNIFIQTAYQASLLATIQSKGPIILRLNKKAIDIDTMIFNSFFLCQLFNIFNAREPEKKNIFRGVHRCKWFWVGIVAALLLQVGFLEIAHIMTGDSRLTYAEWGVCLLVGAISWCIDLAGKCILLMIKKWVTKPKKDPPPLYRQVQLSDITVT